MPSMLSCRLPLLLVPAFLLVWPAAARAEEAQLTILHTADLHGALTSWDYLADRPAARGLARVATLVQRVRSEGGPVLLLDAGDAMQGSPLETVWRRSTGAGPEPMMTAMTRMGYDAMAVGNHEFDFGPTARERTRATAGFPWLAANVVRESDGTPAFAPSLVKTVGSLRVGIVGICTPAVPSLEDSENVAGLRFLPAVDAARHEVERLRGEGRCDLVVILAHTGLDSVAGAQRVGDAQDENVGAELARGVAGADVVILGHTHDVIDSLRMGAALVTQAGQRGEHLGRLDFAFTRASARGPWKLTTRRARVLTVTDSVPVHAPLADFARPYHESTEAALSETLGVASREIASPHGRLEDNGLWELVQRAQLEATGAEVSLAAMFDPNVRIAAGPVTVRHALALYPYDNTLGVVELTGADLKATLERAAGTLALYTFDGGRPLIEPGVPGYQFDAAEGVTYDIDLTRPVGDRVANLSLGGAPLAPERHLRVAVNSYRMNGGGGFVEIQRAPRLPCEPRLVRDVLVSHIRKARTLDGAFTENWSLLPDYAPVPERPFIDLMVRQGVITLAEAMRFNPSDPARRGDLAYWLSRSFGWREKKFSGAFADVPDSLEPWLDGLVRRKVLGIWQQGERFQPFAVAPLSMALDWCEGAARKAGYALGAKTGDASFRRGLLTGIDFGRGVGRTGAFVFRDTITRAQAIAVVANMRFPTVRVLETTDFHGAILPGRERRSNRPLGGSAVLAAWIAKLRAENPEGTVLVDGGDLFQGTMISNLAFGRPVVEQMNALGYAAAAIGNHEFDWTADTLSRRVQEMRFAALGANMTQAKDGKRPRWVRADTLVTRRGVRIGILGLCYPKTPTVTLTKNVAHLRFADDSATAAGRVPALRRAGADLVIGVGHIPADTDSNRRVSGDLARLARGVPGVAAWFGGHSHNRVIGQVAGVPAMIAGSHGEAIAVCDLRVDPIAHRVIDRSYRLETTYGDLVTPDSAMAARVERWNTSVAAIAAEPLGRNTNRLTRTGGAETTVGDLVADAMRAAVGADIAMQNSGGLRADLPEGAVTRGGIYEVMPFDNTIVTMDLTGAEVRQVLEDALRSGRVTQVSGLRYAFDSRRPEMQRVTALFATDGAVLDSARTWKVAVNNFMAGGGDEHRTLARGRNARDTQVLVRDAMERFVRERCAGGASLDFRPDGRISRVQAPGSGGG
jgi:2',3'-cyclic-nucleotide 2'-phosphodiesterase / 3'-nucleotidase / 5'-nucleotidase